MRFRHSQQRWSWILILCLLGWFVATSATHDAVADDESNAAAESATESSDGDAEKADAERKKKREAIEKASHKVERGPFKVDVSLQGTFEATQMNEIALRPEVWSEWIVVEAVEQGARVAAGDTLVKFDSRKLDEAIRDLQTDRELAQLSIEQERKALELLEKSAPLDLEMARRSAQFSADDLRYWESTEREMTEKMVEFMLKSSTLWYENALEELNQLEKMYEADDLTEETEEIILKRQRAQVEFAKFYLDSTKLDHDRTLETEIPRRDERNRQQTKQQELALERIELTQPLLLARKRLELQKMEYERVKSDQRLARLEHDQKLMAIVAEQDGVVYYGRCTRGSWANASSMADRLRKGGTLSANEPFMTLVQPRPMFVRAKLPEKDLRYVKANLQGKVVPEGYSDLKLTAAIASVNTIPVSEGNFEARVTVDLGPDTTALMPGMTCNLQLTPYVQPKALAVPASAVHTEELDDSQHYVWLVIDEVETEKRPVTIGEKSSDTVEIVSGLTDGDTILTKSPDELGLDK